MCSLSSFAALARELGLAAEKRTDPPRLGDYEPVLTASNPG
jgi:hypothetical protein